VLRAELQQANAGGSIRKPPLGPDDEKKEREKNIGCETPTDASHILPCDRARPRLERQRTSIGVPPRFSPQESFIARDSASGQASWDVAGYVLRIL
jgi:hypothetical protein